MDYRNPTIYGDLMAVTVLYLRLVYLWTLVIILKFSHKCLYLVINQPLGLLRPNKSILSYLILSYPWKQM